MQVQYGSVPASHCLYLQAYREKTEYYVAITPQIHHLLVWMNTSRNWTSMVCMPKLQEMSVVPVARNVRPLKRPNRSNELYNNCTKPDTAERIHSLTGNGACTTGWKTTGNRNNVWPRAASLPIARTMCRNERFGHSDLVHAVYQPRMGEP